MHFLILSENSNGTWPHLHFRSMGAFELRRRIVNRGHTAEILDWFTHWNNSDLKKIISLSAKTHNELVIAISTPFNAVDVYKLRPILEWALQKHPDIRIIHGGARNYDESLADLIDIFFLGRSMEMFDVWLDGKDLTAYIQIQEPLVLVNENFNEKIDNPVVPILNDSDLLTSRDILGFEIGVGCKFNCSFCNYELRNAKITKMADPYELRNYLEESYKKYGVKNFFASDDTLNESDEKLEIVAEALSGLSYHPEITAFARLDILTARKTQIDLIERINFRSLFFGIESFNQEASKAVRKKSGFGNNYETLKTIRDISPETYTVGGLIIGLNKDNEQSIFDSVQKVIDERLLSSLQFYPLSITKPEGILGTGFYSDLDKDPEKFEYQITGMLKFHHGNKSMASYAWKSDWTTSYQAELLTNNLYEICEGKIDSLNHLEYAGLYALGLIKSGKKIKYNQLKNQSYNVSTQLKQLYIAKKKKYLGL